MKKILATAAVVTAMISTPAMAWGDREQGILTGIVGTLIIQDIQRNNTQHIPQGGVVVQQPQVIVQQPTVIHRDCGFVQNVYRDGNVTRVVKTDRCTGAVIEERITYR